MDNNIKTSSFTGKDKFKFITLIVALGLIIIVTSMVNNYLKKNTVENVKMKVVKASTSDDSLIEYREIFE